MVVVRLGKADVAADGGNFHVDDLLFNNIEDWEEVERECVLGVVEVWAVVEQALDGSDLGAVFGVVSNSPRITEDLVHALWGDTDDAALLNNSGVLPDTFFNTEHFLNNERRLD